jgi:hypothetical protein
MEMFIGQSGFQVGAGDEWDYVGGRHRRTELFVAVATERLKGSTQRRGELTQAVKNDCLVIGDSLPSVSQVTDPIQLGVHRGRALGERESRVPAYVPRDIDEELRQRLGRPGFVLLVGDSTAGKSRAAYEAMATALPDHVLIAPEHRDALPAAIDIAVGLARCVLWLDNLEAFLGNGGLTRNRVARLLGGPGHHRVILATMRQAELTRYTDDTADDDATRRQLAREARGALDQADPIVVERFFSAAERERAHGSPDPLVVRALNRSRTYGLAEYIAAGPRLFHAWTSAWTPGRNPRGAALVAAAVLGELGRHEEARAELEAVIAARRTALGADIPTRWPAAPSWPGSDSAQRARRDLHQPVGPAPYGGEPRRGQGAGEFVRAEHPDPGHPAERRQARAGHRQARAAGREQHDPAARAQHSRHPRQCRPRVVEQVQPAETAHGVERVVVEGQAGRVAADVRDVRPVARVGGGAAEHGGRGVHADHARAAGGQRPGDVAGTAGDVQHGRVRAAGQAQPVAGDGVLARRARPERAALDQAEQHRPPHALVDLRQHAGVHEPLRDGVTRRHRRLG